MWIKRTSKAQRERDSGAIFKGEVLRQGVVGGDMSKELYLGEITFKDGAANKWHVHSCDQILIVSEGEGIVADEREERQVSAGDVAFIPANTNHWHGARPGKDMKHWSILAGGTTKILD